MYKDLMHSQNKMRLDSFTKLFLFLFALSLIPISTSDALLQQAGKIIVDISPGETRSFSWGLQSDDDKTLTVQIFAEGDGSEFLSFPASMQIEPEEVIFVPFDVMIPKVYDGSLTLSPTIVATEFGDTGSSTVINVQMAKTVNISIIPLQEIETQLTEKLEPSSQSDSPEQIHSEVTITEKQEIAFPLQQVKDGIAPEDVTCKDTFQLLLKPSNGLPVCITQDTFQKLLKRGWIEP